MRANETRSIEKKKEETEYIAIEELELSSGWNSFLPRLTGRTGFLDKRFVPDILKDKPVLQVHTEEFERLLPNMVEVNTVTYE